MANKEQVVSQEELIWQTYDKLVQSGISISKSVLELAIRGYNEVKVDKLTEGSSYKEAGIGTIQPTWRRISKAFDPKERFTPKVVVQMEPNLKSTLKNLLMTSPAFREAVGAEEL